MTQKTLSDGKEGMWCGKAAQVLTMKIDVLKGCLHHISYYWNLPLRCQILQEWRLLRCQKQSKLMKKVYTNGIYKQTTDLQYADWTSEGSFCFDCSQKTQQTKNYRHAKDFQLEPSVLIVSKFGSMFGTCIHVFGGLWRRTGATSGSWNWSPRGACSLIGWDVNRKMQLLFVV